jgi:hypothetical protein
VKKLIVIMGLLVASYARADDVVKPAPMLEGTFKDAPGTWSCVGHWTMPESTTSFTITSKLKIVKELGGREYVGVVTMPKQGAMLAKECHIRWHYDPAEKMLDDTTVCDDGYTSHTQSNGIQGTSSIWTGDATAKDMPSKIRTTTTLKSSSEMLLVNEMEISSNWVKIGDETCKR